MQNFFGNAIRKVFGIGNSIEVLERDHGNGIGRFIACRNRCLGDLSNFLGTAINDDSANRSDCHENDVVRSLETEVFGPVSGGRTDNAI